MSFRPAPAPGASPVGTLFAALHGELALHAGREPSVASQDAYSLFVARSAAMGWLAGAAGHGSVGVWGMNDAGLDPDAGFRPPRAAWFQVSLVDPVPAGTPLPVQAFLACAGDVVARLGALRLEAARVLLPVQSLPTAPGMDAVATLVQGTGWFDDRDPHRRAAVRVTLDGGRDPSIRSAAPGMLAWMQTIKQDVFSCDAFSLADDDAVFLEPEITDQLWLGPSEHRATFRGSLAEWSLDALGWLAAFLADAGSRHGIRTPLMLTASRSEGRLHPPTGRWYAAQE